MIALAQAVIVCTEPMETAAQDWAVASIFITVVLIVGACVWKSR